MDDHLRNSRLFPRYATRVKQVYEELMIESFNSLQEEINKQLECIAIDFQAVVTNEGEIPEAERAPALASELRSLLQAGQATLDDVRGIAKELNESHD
jgi:hypothetical protein